MQPPMRLPVADLHAHPLFHLTYWGNDVGKRQRRPKKWNPFFRCQWDLPGAIEGGVTLQVFTVYVPMRPPRRLRDRDETYRQIEVFRTFCAANADRIAHARTTEEARGINATGRIAAMLAIEGGHSLGRDPREVGRLREIGVRILTLVHFADNGLVQGVEQPFHRQAPLTDLGREVLAEMARHRMIIDVAHMTEASFDAVAEATDEPLVSTHTGVRGLARHYRNLSDAQIDEIARRDGLIGVIPLPLYMKRRVRCDLEDLADVFCYIAERVGTRHVALGTDWDGFIWTPVGLDGVEHLPRVTETLARRGFSEAELGAMMGGNAWRLLARFD